ncbi:zinc finger protein 271-like isoform X2 [Galleria mellonella]|uniref:Zinc finger protein 271-like isoform X2 n=1 Tax=Galleria mellonella TaxID=7137 RepID=A0A6J1W8Y5_GALME|nr:zinc finger protein 271-like isoform X2 [Galleria mellonella]
MDAANRDSLDIKKWHNYCRCCMKTGHFKDITAEYDYYGQKEIYDEMLKGTFNIQIPSVTEYRQICEDCTLRLRDATTFKHMVVETNRIFSEYLSNSLCDVDNKALITEMKLESVKVESLPVASDVFDDDDDCVDDSLDDNEILANIKLELSRDNVNERLESIEKSVKRKCTYKNVPESKKFKSNKVDMDKPQKDWRKIVERRGNGPILREISLKLLANSTMCVFQWNKSRYRCFCCKEPFSDMDTLRHHTAEQHTLENIEKKIIFQQNRLVKVEISELRCRLCNRKMETLQTFRDHLSTTHGMEFTLKEDLLVPFKIQNGDLHCQLCTESFSTFRLLNIHMNKHYQKQVCHICGAGFSNLVFLNLHKTRSHRPLTCKTCDVLFPSKTEKRRHDAVVHGVKVERKLRFPCPYCSERFYQENFRVQHLVEKHGMVKPQFACAVCSKIFITKSLCNNHTKNVHMKEKNHECNVCHNFFYTKSDVLRHSVTHTGEKKFSCGTCNGPFATKDSLRRHMKRAHMGLN